MQIRVSDRSCDTVFTLSAELLEAPYYLRQDQSTKRSQPDLQTAFDQTADTGHEIHGLHSRLAHALPGQCFLRIEFRLVMETKRHDQMHFHTTEEFCS